MSPVYPHTHHLNQSERSALKGHEPACLWFTGLSGSGKSSIANTVEELLNKQYGVHTYLLDGDNIRSGLNRDLGFSIEDRTENLRRLGEVARLFVDAGLIVLTAFISPLRSERERARQILPPGRFIEIYVDCPLAVCEQRDPKGLYKKARLGELAEFTGITSPYEPPDKPDIILHSAEQSIEDCAQQVINYLMDNHIIKG